MSSPTTGTDHYAILEKMYDSTKPYKEQLLELIKQTWASPNLRVEPGLYITTSRPEVDHTDGIGTKGVYHWQARTFRAAVIDALAMNLNDLAMVRARPVKLQNHITLPEDDQEALFEIITALVQECRRFGIVITGGETSIQDTLRGLDISLTINGICTSEKTNRAENGDLIIGFPSSGLHSNGFTRVRALLGEEPRPEFTQPTSIYLADILDLDATYELHGLMHITGGAFTKLKDMLGNNDAIIIRSHPLRPQSIFYELYQKDLTDEEMYQTFNCGVGFIATAAPAIAEQIIKEKPEATIIGQILPGAGQVTVESRFSNRTVNY